MYAQCKFRNRLSCLRQSRHLCAAEGVSVVVGATGSTAAPRGWWRWHSSCANLNIMTNEEQKVLDYIRGSPDSYHGHKEIARKAVRRAEFEENPHWVKAPLASRLDKEIIEMNDSGYYRLKMDDPCQLELRSKESASSTAQSTRLASTSYNARRNSKFESVLASGSD